MSVPTRRRWRVILVIAAVLAGGCAADVTGGDHPRETAASGTSGTAAPVGDDPPATTTTTGPPPLDPDPDAFAAADAALARRVATAGLAGGVSLVVRDGAIVHDHAIGRIDRTTPMATASSAKWLTAATLMTFVDDGALALDDPVGRWLPEFDGDTPAVTVRHLLTHTAGVRDQACLWDTGGRLADCVERVASSPRQFAAGSAFSYGNAGYHVIGRLLEVLGGADFATVFRRRLGEPLGLAATTWPGAPGNPSPAAGARTTVDDYARFLALLAAHGHHEGRPLLSPAAVGELTRDQVGAYDKAGDEAVGITTIPRYALGAWPDEVDGTGATIVVSGNGGRGFYPWIDLTTRSWGVIGVQDDRGAAVAVPASQQVARLTWQAARGS